MIQNKLHAKLLLFTNNTSSSTTFWLISIVWMYFFGQKLRCMAQRNRIYTGLHQVFVSFDLLIGFVDTKTGYTLPAWRERGVSVACQLRGFFDVFTHQKRV